MQPITSGMAALFAARKWYTAKLFTITLFDGTVLRYCSGDIDLVVSGQTYSCGGITGPYWDREANKAKTHLAIGTNVDTLTVDVIPGTSTVEGFPFQLAIRYGIFDGADFLYQRINMATPGDTSAGPITRFGGRVAPVEYANSLATFTVNSHLELLNMPMPRNIFQAGCLNTLFDTGCTLSSGAFVNAGAVTSSPAATAFAFGISGAAAAQATGYFNLGTVQFTSGRNNGLTRAVQSHTGGGTPQLVVFPPFPFAPAVGDSFSALPGCDKQLATCIAKFNNKANFRGTPLTPQAETAV